MRLKKTLVELTLSAFLVGLTGCSTINTVSQDKSGEASEWLYPKIEQDIRYILERAKKDKELYCEVDNQDFYHVHICLKAENEKDHRIKQREINPQNIIFLYHSRECLPNENVRRNIFHYPDESWNMQKNIFHKGIYPEDVGLNGVTIYFGKTKKELMEHPVDKFTVRRVGDYYFGVSGVFPFLKE